MATLYSSGGVPNLKRQFIADAFLSPGRIFSGHLADQGAEIRDHR
jgi:hypothetical protein